MKLDTVHEEKAIENLTGRLIAGDPVRDYVPILIERMVKEELTPKPEAEPETDGASKWTGPPSGTAVAADAPRRRIPVALPAAVAGVLVLATVATVLAVRDGNDARATSGLITVSGVIGSEKRAYFEDPDVKAALAEHGFEVKVDAAKYPVFSSPMAIATFQPIVDLLSAGGIARKVDGTWYFDVRKYVDLAKANWRWTNIRGNMTYPVNKRILITTTDPRTSNSAAMFLSIVTYVANHNSVAQSAADEKKVLPLVTPLFVNQGYTDNSSEGPFDDYLSLGMGKSPMVNIYEAQFVEAAVEHKLKPGMVLMYPCSPSTRWSR
ncbi:MULTISPECIES: hypothetical protein [Kribbella]|uniref:hypothetical protein n=1 Tax=Kribbella TaxID=182639 RepID=UPI002F760F9D